MQIRSSTIDLHVFRSRCRVLFKEKSGDQQGAFDLIFEALSKDMEELVEEVKTWLALHPSP